MSDRFYVSEGFQESQVELEGSEAHHLIHVLRRQVGETVSIFDGCGNEAAAEIAELTRRSARLRIVSRLELETDGPQRCTIAVAAPKGDRLRWLG